MASRIYPPSREEVDEIHGDVVFPDSHPGDPSLPYVAMNMVSSLDGKASVGGKSGSIGGAVDRETMRVLRSKVDAVAVGAGTVRAEKASLTSGGRRSPEPFAVIVSSTLDIPFENLPHTTRERTIILTCKDSNPTMLGEARERGRILTFPPGDGGNRLIDIGGAMRVLKSRHGVGSVLVEGGPRLNHAFIRGGLASEIFLTLSPKILGGDPLETGGIIIGELPGAGEPPRGELLSIHMPEAAGEPGCLFLRYALESPGFR